MGLREDFKPYLDSRGLVSGELYPKLPEGNAILKTAHYGMLLKEHALWGEQDSNELVSNIVRECEIVPGLYRRAQNWVGDLEQRDDYFGLAYLSTITGHPFAKYILWFGRKHTFAWFLPYAFDNVKWDKMSPKFYQHPNASTNTWDRNAWLGRHLELIAALKWAAGETPNWLEKKVFCYGLANAGSATDQDGWMLGILQAAIVEPFARVPGTLEFWALAKFCMRLNEMGGLNPIYAAYLKNPDHPLARYWSDTPRSLP